MEHRDYTLNGRRDESDVDPQSRECCRLQSLLEELAHLEIGAG